MNRCKIALSSVTYALKGQSVLKQYALPAEIVRLQAHETSKGCAYGLAVDCAQLQNAAALLAKHDVPFSEALR